MSPVAGKIPAVEKKRLYLHVFLCSWHYTNWTLAGIRKKIYTLKKLYKVVQYSSFIPPLLLNSLYEFGVPSSWTNERVKWKTSNHNFRFILTLMTNMHMQVIDDRYWSRITKWTVRFIFSNVWLTLIAKQYGIHKLIAVWFKIESWTA